MPPHQMEEVAILESASPVVAPQQQPRSPSSFPRNILHKYSSFEKSEESSIKRGLFRMDMDLLDLAADEQQTDVACYEHFSTTFQSVLARVDALVHALDDEDATTKSPVRDACRQSLTVTFPMMVSKVSALLDSMKMNIEIQTTGINSVVKANSNGDDGFFNRGGMIRKLRATFALVNCVQFLDTIEAGMVSTSRACFDKQLASVLDKILEKSNGIPTTPVFRVSHWIAPTLAFDIPAGEIVRASLDGCSDGGGDQVPLTIQVEPIITFKGEDLVAGGDDDRNRNAYRRCAIVVESCAHKSKGFAEGAGAVGIAQIRIRVEPIDEEIGKAPIWGEKEILKKLCVTDARVVQHNAFPPTPRSQIHLYTSYVYGDPAASARLDIQTYVTQNGEAPHLAVELYIASCDP